MKYYTIISTKSVVQNIIITNVCEVSVNHVVQSARKVIQSHVIANEREAIQNLPVYFACIHTRLMI